MRVVSIFILLGFFLASSCGSNTYLYDKSGFDEGILPKEQNPNGPVRVAPDYYYRQPQYPYQQPYPPQPYPPQAAPYPYQQPYPPQYPQRIPPQGGSRFYSNPYAIPPSDYYPQYDADQYYVPPTYYQNIEKPPEFINRGSAPF